MPSDLPCPQRWFDDFEAGERFTFGSVVMDEGEIIEFGRKFDPQPFHTDPTCRGSLPSLILLQSMPLRSLAGIST